MAAGTLRASGEKVPPVASRAFEKMIAETANHDAQAEIQKRTSAFQATA